MATSNKRANFICEQVYGEDDLVDDFFFDELAKHIAATKLASLAEYLDLPEANNDILQDFFVQSTSVQRVRHNIILYMAKF